MLKKQKKYSCLMMPIAIQVILLIFTTLYQAIASFLEDRKPPIGQLIDVGGYRLHLYTLGDTLLEFRLKKVRKAE